MDAFACVYLFIVLILNTNASHNGPLEYPLNDGYKIPSVALGTSLGNTANGTRILPENNSVARAVQWALQSGYRHIDTATLYQTEHEVGLGIQEFIKQNNANRNDLFVTTKLWNDAHDTQDVVPALRKSLKELNLDYVDLYLIHFPMAYNKDDTISQTPFIDTWKGMEQAKDLNLTRSIGVSNFNLTQMQTLLDNARIKPAVLQIEVNPTITESELIDWCQKRDIVVMAYSPFGGILGRKKDAPPPHKDDPKLKQLSQKYNKSVPQILLRYLLDRNLVAIPRSTNKERIIENINILDFELTPEEVLELSAFNKNHRLRTLAKWYKHPLFPFEKRNVTEERNFI